MADAKERERLAILEWDKKTFAELKKECTSRGLDTLGGKHDLIKRLVASSGAAAPPSSPAVSSPPLAGSSTLARSVASPPASKPQG